VRSALWKPNYSYPYWDYPYRYSEYPYPNWDYPYRYSEYPYPNSDYPYRYSEYPYRYWDYPYRYSEYPYPNWELREVRAVLTPAVLACARVCLEHRQIGKAGRCAAVALRRRGFPIANVSPPDVATQGRRPLPQWMYHSRAPAPTPIP
jgi:hypothetical protein